MDFKRSCKLTSNKKDYDPEYILKKLRKNQINHGQFDPALYKATKKRLDDLIKSIPEATKP